MIIGLDEHLKMNIWPSEGYFSLCSVNVFSRKVLDSLEMNLIYLYLTFFFINSLRIIYPVYFDYIHLHNSSKIQPPSLAIQLCVIIFQNSSTPVCAAHLLLSVWGSIGAWWTSQWPDSLKKPDSPSLSSYQLPIAPQILKAIKLLVIRLLWKT